MLHAFADKLAQSTGMTWKLEKGLWSTEVNFPKYYPFNHRYPDWQQQSYAKYNALVGSETTTKAYNAITSCLFSHEFLQTTGTSVECSLSRNSNTVKVKIYLNLELIPDNILLQALQSQAEHYQNTLWDRLNIPMLPSNGFQPFIPETPEKSALFKAIANADIAKAIELIQQNPRLLNSRDNNNGATPLTACLYHSKRTYSNHLSEELLKLANWIVKQPITDLRMKDKNSETALHLALWYEYTELAKRLIEHASSKNQMGSLCVIKNSHHKTPLENLYFRMKNTTLADEEVATLDLLLRNSYGNDKKIVTPQNSNNNNVKTLTSTVTSTSTTSNSSASLSDNDTHTKFVEDLLEALEDVVTLTMLENPYILPTSGKSISKASLDQLNPKKDPFNRDPIVDNQCIKNHLAAHIIQLVTSHDADAKLIYQKLETLLVSAASQKPLINPEINPTDGLTYEKGEKANGVPNRLITTLMEISQSYKKYFVAKSVEASLTSTSIVSKELAAAQAPSSSSQPISLKRLQLKNLFLEHHDMLLKLVSHANDPLLLASYTAHYNGSFANNTVLIANNLWLALEAIECDELSFTPTAKNLPIYPEAALEFIFANPQFNKNLFTGFLQNYFGNPHADPTIEKSQAEEFNQLMAVILSPETPSVTANTSTGVNLPPANTTTTYSNLSVNPIHSHGITLSKTQDGKLSFAFKDATACRNFLQQMNVDVNKKDAYIQYSPEYPHQFFIHGVHFFEDAKYVSIQFSHPLHNQHFVKLLGIPATDLNFGTIFPRFATLLKQIINVQTPGMTTAFSQSHANANIANIYLDLFNNANSPLKQCITLYSAITFNHAGMNTVRQHLSLQLDAIKTFILQQGVSEQLLQSLTKTLQEYAKNPDDNQYQLLQDLGTTLPHTELRYIALLNPTNLILPLGKSLNAPHSSVNITLPPPRPDAENNVRIGKSRRFG